MGKLATTGGRRVTRDNEEDQAASACPCGPSGASSGRAFVAEPVRGIAPRGDAVPRVVLDPDREERVRLCRSWIFGSLVPGRDPPSRREATCLPLETAATTYPSPLETATGTDPSLHRLRGHASHRQPIHVDDPGCPVFRDSKERVPTTGGGQRVRTFLGTAIGSHANRNRPIRDDDPPRAVFRDSQERTPVSANSDEPVSVTRALQRTRPALETATGTYPLLHGFHANRNVHRRSTREDDPPCKASRHSEERVPVTGVVETTRPPLEAATRTCPSSHGFNTVDHPCFPESENIKKRVPASRKFEETVPVIRRVPTTRSTRSTRLLVATAILAMCTLAAAVPTPKSYRTDPLRTGLRRDLVDSTGLEDVYEDAFEDVFREEDRTNAGTVLDENELEIIRRSIARGLGLKRIPDPAKANVSQTEYERAHREYLKKVHLSFDEETSKSRRNLHVFHAAAHPGNGSSRIDRGQHRHRLFFPVEIPEVDGNASVDHATLRLLLHGDYSERSEELDVQLYLNVFGSRRLIARKRISGRDSRWLELDSTLAASSWLETGLENLGLELEFLQDEEIVKRSLSSPALNVFTESSESNGIRDGSSRSKRSTPEELMSLHRGRRTKCKGESKKCCRHELTVMFKDLKGFEFIVYPKTFDAGYCKGRCPPRYNPAHHHALLQSLLWKEDRKKVPKPCCAPSKLDQLMIVYFDENDSTKLKVSYWKNIKVLECACS